MNRLDTIQATMNALDRRAAFCEDHQGLGISDDIQIAIARFLGEIAIDLDRIASALEGLERK